GMEAIVVNPEPSGALDPERFLEAVAPGTAVATLMAANNEYGGLFPVAQLAGEARRRGAIFHTDAVQAIGRVPINVGDWAVDLLSLSAHKFHGPKGAGALFVRKGVQLSAHTPGGGQEKKLRAGTENTVAIVGLGAAARLARERLEEASAIAGLRDRLERGVLERVEGTRAVGAVGPRLPNTSAILFEDVSGETLLMRLDLEGVAVSVGSACSSGTLAPSPAILSLGLSETEAKSVVRFSLSRLTTAAEIDTVLELLPRVVEEGRRSMAGA
ncbi:MAG TPA: aminotransferase class V-fold PLP-dependent enzyme, partial [Thermoanaerobaculia bacterium]|nr:aminotransferase class V-fold PLP-dependent enzyme [Thermoanaerobaculia bacterium]